MKHFLLGLLGFVVVWVAGLAPQFLNYFHISWIIIFSLEGLVSIAGYVLFVRLIEKRKAAEISRFRVSLLPFGTFIGLVWFALLMLMLYLAGHYQIIGVGFPNRVLSAVIFALGTAIWEEVLFVDCSFALANKPLARGSASSFRRSRSVRFTDSIQTRPWLRRSQSFSNRDCFSLRLISPPGHSGYRSACTSDGILPRTSSLASGCRDTPRVQLSWKEH